MTRSPKTSSRPKAQPEAEASGPTAEVGDPPAVAPAPAESADPAPTPPPVATPKPLGGKLGVMAALLSRPEGATVAQLVEATGWQAHSVRGAMAGALKARGLTLTSEKTDGVRTYRAAVSAEVAA